MASRPPPRRDEYDYDDYYAPPPRRGPSPRSQRGRAPSHDRELESTTVRVRDRDRDVSRGPPAFLRDDGRRPPEHGPMVLRKKEVETIDRHTSPSPGPIRRRGRSPSRGPPMETEHLRERFVERERERVRSPSEVRAREPRPPSFVARRPRSLSPLPPRPPPEREERFRTRIVRRDEERYSSSPSPSPSPPPQPQVVRGPTLEREVITHYTDIDHGMIQARPQPPPPQPAPRPRQRRAPPREEEETDIDISLGRHHTEVDVRRITRSRSRGRHVHYHDDELGDDRPLRSRPRAYSDERPRYYDDEEREIVERIDSRGRMGEAWGGATKDWEIVDVPPGTERVRMDGKGGGSTETSWTKYGGVRRTKFIPERDARPERAPAALPAPPPPPPPSKSRERVDVSVDDRVVDIDIRTSTRTSEREPELRTTTNQVTARKDETWTEITKELVTRDAIEQMGYHYEEAPGHFYIMQYLAQNEVQRLMDLTMRIRKERWDELHRQREWEKKTYYHDDTEVSYHRHRHHHEYPLAPYVPPPPVAVPAPPPRRSHRSNHRPSHSTWEWDTETLREHEYSRQSAGARGPVEGWYRSGY